MSVQATAGSLTEPVEVDLDAYGTARVEVSCDRALDDACATSTRFRVTGSWTLEGTAVTGDLIIPLEVVPSSETGCGNGVDDDEDGLIDCADPDCETRTCSDGEPCTQNERCQAGSCGGGQPVSCTNPPDTFCAAGTGTCQPGFGCVYPPQHVGEPCNDDDACTRGDRCTSQGTCSGAGTSCPDSNSPCEKNPGHCDSATGRCVYATKRDGDSCGTTAASRCCSGSCVDISLDWRNCGGCGVRCGTSQCLDAAATSCQPPIDVSGRCTCTSDVDCPQDTHCTRGLCEPTLCHSPEYIVLGSASCLAFCRY